MSQLEETQESLSRMQAFDPKSLAREEDLGRNFDFSAIVAPASKLIRLYNQLGLTTLDDFPGPILTQIKQQADADFNRFQQVLDFDPTTVQNQNPTQPRDQLIQQVTNAYDPAFQKLFPFISYGTSKSVDFQRMENEARAMLQNVKDEASEITEQLSEHQEQAQGVLADVRRVAAEQGVSQQAIYFKDEAEAHEELAETWRSRTTKLAWGLGGYAFLSIFFHKWSWLQPEDTIQSIQLVTSKILIFGVISYMLFLSAKNFLSHKHSAIINKHRQNALMTYTAITDSAATEESKDVVLNHASACIFSPQDTGFIKSQSQQSSTTRSVVELLPKTTMKLDAQ
ncbi:hypothetical protein SAMN05421686_109129 [Thalassolituus maritimus]|uniref:Uncharacterized protein n=1 Tax=Thalassolituus maritimus TaxID=484498 RepID=A0A1N7PEH0_9GAMM|nr:hypothetical protein [Thalassolituus maritimus]SIT08964.1 hypothetical protein SAMN05421686_109129 [Thalassolituus maritimus]